MKDMRNPHLTPAAEKILKFLETEEGEGDLVVEGIEAWIGFERTSVAAVNRLLRLCLLHDDSKDGAMGECKARYYSINEEGRRVLRDANYVPMIVKHLKKYLRKRAKDTV